jgi:hypothetical protein
MGLWQRRWLALAAVTAAGMAPGCAHRVGERASSGMVAGIQSAASEAADAPPEQQLSRRMAGRAVAGALETLDTPEQRARLQAIVAAAVDSATRAAISGVTAALDDATDSAIQGMTAAVDRATRAAIDAAAGQLVAQLGRAGDGPLGQSLARTGAGVSAAVVGSVVSGVGDGLVGLTPGCEGAERAGCIERRLGGLAQATGAGFAAGVAKSIRWPVLMLDFAAGALAGVLGAWLWSLRHHRVRRFQTA